MSTKDFSSPVKFFLYLGPLGPIYCTHDEEFADEYSTKIFSSSKIFLIINFAKDKARQGKNLAKNGVSQKIKFLLYILSRRIFVNKFFVMCRRALSGWSFRKRTRISQLFLSGKWKYFFYLVDSKCGQFDQFTQVIVKKCWIMTKNADSFRS